MRTCNKRIFIEISSEPGDCTHYNYGIYYDVIQGIVYFIPLKNSFKYPKSIFYREVMEMWERIKNITDIHKQVEVLVNEYSYIECNPYTLRECIISVKELI